jgi:hypothetical protein
LAPASDEETSAVPPAASTAAPGKIIFPGRPGRPRRLRPRTSRRRAPRRTRRRQAIFSRRVERGRLRARPPSYVHFVARLQ